MGLIVPQTVKIRTSTITCKHYKEKGYTFKKCGEFIEVDVMDLYPGSHEKVKIICDICGNESEIGYRDFVKSRKKGILVSCKSNSCINKKREDTCIKKYGVKYIFQAEEVKEKIKDTNLGRYGAENPFGSKEIRDKIKDTWQKNYGENITNPGQAQDVKDKIKATLKEKHGEGIICSFQLESVKEKSKQTWQKNYGEGIINPGQAQVVKDKIKDTWKNNYGEDITCPFQVESVKEKSKQTMLNNYGVEYAMQNEEIRNKSKTTCLLHWGVNNPFQSEEVKEKIKDTNLERYGAENPMQCKEIQDKSKETCRKKYGGNTPMSSNDVKNKVRQTWEEKYGVDHPSKLQEIKDKKKETCRNHFGVDWPMQYDEIKNKAFDSFQYNSTGPSSRAQRYINYILNGILNKHILNFMVDIYLEKENLVIEYDGSGHFLGDTIKNKSKIPSKEAILKEKAREDKLINNNYKLIRIIAKRDRIPSDEVILNLIDEFKNSDFKVIRIDIDEGTISKDDTEKWNYNFGELRKITKEDLEKFENNNNRLEN